MSTPTGATLARRRSPVAHRARRRTDRVTEQVPIEVSPNEENLRYLTAKLDRLGHTLQRQGPELGEHRDGVATSRM